MTRNHLTLIEGGTAEHDDHYFGVCPECHDTDGYINVGKSHWFHCLEHRVRWCVGSNLFSSWKHETEDEQRARYDELDFGSFRTASIGETRCPAA